MIHDIVDYNGSLIGHLELPDETPNEVVQEKLNRYKTQPIDVEVIPE